MDALTKQALRGEVPFFQSFEQRFALLRDIPVSAVQEAVLRVPLDPDITAFNAANTACCAVVTANLDCWAGPLLRKLGCRFFTSESSVCNGMPQLHAILDKGAAVKALRSGDKRIVAIGESANDIPMFREADICIAFGGVHPPAPELREMAQYYASSGKELCGLLGEIQKTGMPESALAAGG
jgi:phosphoserine phosphatase